MKNFKFIAFLFILLLAQKVYCEHNNKAENYHSQIGKEDNLSFEKTDSFIYDFGELPSVHVSFNNISETSISIFTKQKLRELFLTLLHSKTSLIYNHLFQQVSVFGRYSSASLQIFLRTACFRL